MGRGSFGKVFQVMRPNSSSYLALSGGVISRAASVPSRQCQRTRAKSREQHISNKCFCQVRKRDTREIYAMKVLKKEVLVKRKQVGHTRTERQILETVSHPFMVRRQRADMS